MTLVPFGKYKDRPVEDMLADAEYMRWLEAQPWFRDRFGHLLAGRDADAATRTPEHNRLQALFLDPVYRLAFARHAAADLLTHLEREILETRAEAIADIEQAIGSFSAEIERHQTWLNANDHDPKHYYVQEVARRVPRVAELTAQKTAKLEARYDTFTTVSFETKASDVRIGCAYCTEAHWKKYGASTFDLEVEIKPTVADEYPAVLRQMRRNGSTYLFVGRYTGEGVTEAQFVAIFKASGRTVVFKRDVDALVG